MDPATRARLEQREKRLHLDLLAWCAKENLAVTVAADIVTAAAEPGIHLGDRA